MSAKRKIHRFIPTAIPIEGELVRIRVHRFTQTELTDELGVMNEITRTPPEGPQGLADLMAKVRDNHRRMIRDYVVVEQDELEDPDGKPVLTGAQLLALFPGQDELVSALGGLIFAENRLSEAQKRDFRSQVGSVLGWTAWIATPSGGAPEPTADSASAPDSSASAAATSQPTPSADASSGATAPSTSDAVPSAA